MLLLVVSWGSDRDDRFVITNYEQVGIHICQSLLMLRSIILVFDVEFELQLFVYMHMIIVVILCDAVTGWGHVDGVKQWPQC